MKTVSFVFALLAAALVATTAMATPPPGWTEDYTKAVEKAKTEKKNVLLDFTGSDWCGYCMALEKEVFQTPKFKAWAKKNVVLMRIDFPHAVFQSPKIKKQNAELKTKFPANGYPTVLVVDPEGKVLARTSGYSPGSGPDAFIALLGEGAVKQ